MDFLSYTFKSLRSLITLDSVQKTAAIMVPVVAGVWVGWLYLSQREHVPQANITHEVLAIELGDDKVLVRLDVSITNTSTVLLNIEEVEASLKRVIPVDDWAAELFPWPSEETAPSRKLSPMFMWPDILTHSGKVDLYIEPGETHEMSFDFIINRRKAKVVLPVA